MLRFQYNFVFIPGITKWGIFSAKSGYFYYAIHMQIFDEIKARGVEDVLFISMDGVSGLEEGAGSIFKDAVVQRCIENFARTEKKRFAYAGV